MSRRAVLAEIGTPSLVQRADLGVRRNDLEALGEWRSSSASRKCCGSPGPRRRRRRRLVALAWVAAAAGLRRL